jgi:biotin carboxylase
MQSTAESHMNAQLATSQDRAASSATATPIRNVVLICHVGRAGYNVQRALREIGVRTFLVYDDRSSSMRWSTGCTALYRADNLITVDAAVVARKINELHQCAPISSVIPTDLSASLLLAGMKSRLIPPTFPIADFATLQQLDDKWEFAKLCMAHGVAIPRTLQFMSNSTINPEQIETELGYPAIVKPVSGFGQRNIVILRDREEAKQFQAAFSHPNGMVVQEYLSGRDWSLSVFARNGVVTHWAAWQCPAQLEATYGVARFMTTSFRHHEVLAEMGRKIVTAAHFSGVANFDARLAGERDMVLLECNPRFFNRMLAARMCGLNFVAAGLPDCGFSQRATLADGDYYPWQEFFTTMGLKLLSSGQWKISHLLRDVGEMLQDPLPPLVRKISGEENRDRP